MPRPNTRNALRLALLSDTMALTACANFNIPGLGSGRSEAAPAPVTVAAPAWIIHSPNEEGYR